MAAISDPEGESNKIQWAAKQTDVSQLIQAYQHWYSWADANEWASGAAFLKQVGNLGVGNVEAIKILTQQITYYCNSRLKSSIYLYNAARDALLIACKCIKRDK